MIYRVDVLRERDRDRERDREREGEREREREKCLCVARRGKNEFLRSCHSFLHSGDRPQTGAGRYERDVTSLSCLPKKRERKGENCGGRDYGECEGGMMCGCVMVVCGEYRKFQNASRPCRSGGVDDVC
jgi:hypothetical protein